MNHIENKKQAPLVSLQLQRIRGFEILHFFTEIGVTKVSQLLTMRIYDFLNLNHIDNNIAEEALLCLYRYFYPEREELDEMIRCYEMDQLVDLRRWRRTINCRQVTVIYHMYSKKVNDLIHRMLE